MKLNVATAKMLSNLAFRNLFSHWQKNLIVGSIMAFGTILVVFGTAILDSVEFSMSRSIISSFSGHLQLYSEDARDDLALFGGGMMGASDIGELSTFAQIRKRLEAIPGVKAVIPMGLNNAAMSTGNEMDRLLDDLRALVRENENKPIQEKISQIRSVLELLENEIKRRLDLSAVPDKLQGQLADIKKARSDAFWDGFFQDTEQSITFLESKIAQIAPDDRLIYLKYLGTDLERFSKAFDRFEIVNGAMVPPGKRGFLVNQKVYDKWLKNKVAREMDEIEKAINVDNKTIKDDAKLASRVKRMSRLYRAVTFQLSPSESEALSIKLKAILKRDDGDISELFQQYLMVSDENFEERYNFFYENVAPIIKLYRVGIGEDLTARAYTKSGYVKSVRTKVYGTFRFKGLEASDLAGGTSLVDMMTFRELYGAVSEDTKAEVNKIQQEVGIDDVNQDSVEADLFGGSDDIELTEDETSDELIDEFAGIDLEAGSKKRKGLSDFTFDQAAIDAGLALNAAIILDDKDRIDELKARIEKVSADEGLGIKVVTWRQAAGMVGQFIVLVRVVLYVIISITFLVALVIINNSMIMATMERVTEIGTIRAIGAQQTFVLLMFLLETMVLGLVAGMTGSGIGAMIVLILGKIGIPATTPIMVFLFSGPRLFPTVEAYHLFFAAVVILIVSIVSTMYPALIATRVEPVVAMQARE